MCLHTLIGALYVVIPALFALACTALAYIADMCPIPEEDDAMVEANVVVEAIVAHHSQRAIRALHEVAYWHERYELATSEDERRKAAGYRDVWSDEAFDRRMCAINVQCG